MPPKRKQANDDAAPAARPTRVSSRTKTNTTKATTKPTAASSSKTSARKTTGRAPAKGNTVEASTSSTTEGITSADPDAMEVVEPPPAKRTRKNAAAPKKATTKSAEKIAQRSESGTVIDDDALPAGKSSTIREYPPLAPSNSTPVVLPASKPVASKSSAQAAQRDPYSPQRALSLFSTYADSDDPNVIGHEGFERLCIDASLPMDGARPIIMCWLMGAKEMGNIAQAEWVALTTSLKISYIDQLSLAISELEDLLIYDKPPIKASTQKDQEYDRIMYLSYALDPKSAFRKLYQFTFALAKPEQSRNIDMETSLAFWTVLLAPKYPIMSEVLSFISEKGTYRATNKDLWTMMLEFCETVKPNLQEYEADGAWPTLLDDFVLWKKNETGNGTAASVDTDH